MARRRLGRCHCSVRRNGRPRPAHAFPALYFLDADGFLSADIRIVATARAEMSRSDFIAKTKDSVALRVGDLIEEVWARFEARLDYVGADATTPKGAEKLKTAVGRAVTPCSMLAVSPSLYSQICSSLQASGLATPTSRIVMEKPIGHDLQSSKAINQAVGKVFSEDRVFRIDHYLGKETVQNLIALRFANTLFEPLEQSDHRPCADHRGRDRRGRRPLALLCTNMAPCATCCRTTCCSCSAWWPWSRPPTWSRNSVRNEKVKVLRSLRPFTRADAAPSSVRVSMRQASSPARRSRAMRKNGVSPRE